VSLVDNHLDNPRVSLLVNPVDSLVHNPAHNPVDNPADNLRSNLRASPVGSLLGIHQAMHVTPSFLTAAQIQQMIDRSMVPDRNTPISGITTSDRSSDKKIPESPEMDTSSCLWFVRPRPQLDEPLLASPHHGQAFDSPLCLAHVQCKGLGNSAKVTAHLCANIAESDQCPFSFSNSNQYSFSCQTFYSSP
jgi:hypothetical protein